VIGAKLTHDDNEKRGNGNNRNGKASMERAMNGKKDGSDDSEKRAMTTRNDPNR